jgi:Spy/CpxP family protein refolding chaperone
MRTSMRHLLVPLAGLAALVLLAGPAPAQEPTAPAPAAGQHRMQGQGMQGQGMHAGMQQGGGMGGGMLGGMSDAEKEALRAGQGLGAGRIAMQAGYPGPRHVLEMGDELELTAGQKEKIGTIYAEAKASFAKLGAELVEKEEALEAMFASGDVDVGDMKKLSAEIGERQGELRAAHLAAHVRTKEALTAAQLEKLSSMAGAHGGMGQGMGGQHQGMGAQHQRGQDPPPRS